MDAILITFISLFFLVFLIKVYRLNGNLFSITWLVGLYIAFLYAGGLYFYYTQNHYTFVFVFFIAVFFMFGVYLASFRLTTTQPAIRTRALRLYNPINLSVLKFCLIGIYLAAISVCIYRLLMHGSALFAGTWYSPDAIATTTGIVNRLIFTLGADNLLILTIILFALYKSEQKSVFKSMSILSFCTYIFFLTLNGGKAVAIMPFLLMGIAFYYSDQQISKRMWVAVISTILSLVFFIGSFWADVFSATTIAGVFAKRLTSVATETLDFLLYGWAPNHSWELGNTVVLEIKRLWAQLGLSEKVPLFNEYIGNMKGNKALDRVTGFSPELSLFGMSYANFGMLGAMSSALLWGYLVQRINNYLKSCESMTVFAFTFWAYFGFKVLAFVKTGNFFIFIQSFCIGIVPTFLLIAISYLFLGLPFPNVLKWKRLEAKRIAN